MAFGQKLQVRYMKTAPGVIFYRYAYAEEFKQIHVLALGQQNHLHKLLRACDRRIPITAAKKRRPQETLCPTSHFT